MYLSKKHFQFDSFTGNTYTKTERPVHCVLFVLQNFEVNRSLINVECYESLTIIILYIIHCALRKTISLSLINNNQNLYYNSWYINVIQTNTILSHSTAHRAALHLQ